MEYKVKYDDMDLLDNSIRAQIAEWSAVLDEINRSTETLVGTNNMSGSTASNMKSYLRGVYGSIQAGLNVAIASFQRNWLVYRQDYRGIEGADHAVINTGEIDALNQSLLARQSEKGFVETETRNAVSSVSDISHAQFQDITAVHTIHVELAKKLTQLIENVDRLETSHATGDFDQIDQTIQSLRTLIAEMLGQKTIYKTQFSETAFAASAAYRNLLSAYDSVVGDMQSKQELVRAASAGEQEHVDALKQEADERRKKAEMAKTIAMGLCIVGGIAATVLTAGAASPILVGAISGGVTGAIMAGVNTGADMYAADGWDKMNWGEIGKEALIGGIKGAATGAVTGYFTQATSGWGDALVGKLPGDTVSSVKIGVKAIGKGLSGSVTKTASGFTERLLDPLLHGQGEVAALENAADKDKVLGDVLSGGFKSGTSSVLKDISGSYGSFKIEEEDQMWEKVLKKGGTGAISETGGGIIGRFTKEFALSDGNIQDRLYNAGNKAMDVDSISKDASAGFLSEAGQEYVTDAGTKYTTRNARRNAEEDAYEYARKVNGSYKRDTIEKIESETGVYGVKRTQTDNLDYSDTDQIIEVNGERAIVKIKMVDGKGGDYKAATEALREKTGLTELQQPDNSVWQHMDIEVDEKTGDIYCEMQLVPREIHNPMKHCGGHGQLKEYENQLPLEQTKANQEGAKSVLYSKKAIGNNKKTDTYKVDMGNVKVIEIQHSMPYFAT